MKLLIACLLPAMMVCGAQPNTKQPAKTASRKSAAPVKGIQIPAGAQEIEPNLYRFTDKSGKKWLYRRTPFGVMRSEEVAAAAPSGDDSQISATDAGDSVRFVRQTPFGPMRWERNKTELTEVERAVWERDQARSGQKD